MEYARGKGDNKKNNPYKDYRKSPMQEIYHRLSSTILPFKVKQALIFGGSLISLLIIVLIVTILCQKHSFAPVGNDTNPNDFNKGDVCIFQHKKYKLLRLLFEVQK